MITHLFYQQIQPNVLLSHWIVKGICDHVHVKILGAAGAISPVPAGLRVRD